MKPILSMYLSSDRPDFEQPYSQTRSIFGSPLLERLNSILQLPNPMSDPPTYFIPNLLWDLCRIRLGLDSRTLLRRLCLILDFPRTSNVKAVHLGQLVESIAGRFAV